MEITPEQIKRGRERTRMTQDQLAEAVGVSKRTIGSWERGETIPRNRLGALAEVLALGDSVPEFGSQALLSRIGYLAKQRREEIGVSRRTFAVESGVGSDKTIAMFEFGRTLPHGTTQRKIEKALSWRLGAIEDVMRMVDRKASSIGMELVDAEDSLFIAKESGVQSLAQVSDEALLAELGRRLKTFHAAFPKTEQYLYDLAASTNSEHLEGEDPEADD